jgi:hypothetical protein
MIGVKEYNLFSHIGIITNMSVSLPQGGFIVDVFERYGNIIAAVLCDDTRPYVIRQFHCVSAFYDLNLPPGKKYWHVGTVIDVTPPVVTRYYIIESEI